MRIQTLYDSGTAKVPEDSIVFAPPIFFGVADGVSGVYLPEEGPKLFKVRTGGQLASSVLVQTFHCATPKMGLARILRCANNTLRGIAKTEGLSISQPAFLPSATLVVAKIGPNCIKIVQAGDSLAVWEYTNGNVGGISNPMFTYEKRHLNTIARLMEKHKGDRQKMWGEFRPTLIQQRNTHVNIAGKEVALLNGQARFLDCLHLSALSVQDIKLLVLFTDGFVSFEDTENGGELAQKVIGLYRQGELQAVLNNTRKEAEKKKSSSHEDFPEATAIAIEF